LAIAATGFVLRRRPSPAAHERKRRLTVNAKGRMAEATVVDFRGDELFYSYTVRGAQYTAAQDISDVRDRLPSDAPGILGPAKVKYHPANPANSILVSEEWSGLRSAGPQNIGEERSLP
jgi:hypothetical protein